MSPPPLLAVMKLDGSQPVRYGIKLELDDKYRRVKEVVAEMCGICPSSLRLAEVYGATVKVFVPHSIKLCLHSCLCTQSLPADTTKIRSVLGGYLYAFEIPPPPPVRPTSRSDSPDEVQRKLKKIKIERERTLSLKGAQAERLKAQRARERVAKMQHGENMEDEESMTVDDGDEPDEHDGLAQVSDEEGGGHSRGRDVLASPQPAGMEESDGFVFAIHRRTVSERNREGRERLHVCFYTVLDRALLHSPPEDSSHAVWYSSGGPLRGFHHGETALLVRLVPSGETYHP